LIICPDAAANSLNILLISVTYKASWLKGDTRRESRPGAVRIFKGSSGICCGACGKKEVKMNETALAGFIVFGFVLVGLLSCAGSRPRVEAAQS